MKLYTADVLALATSLTQWPFDSAMPRIGMARSPSCGSTLTMSLSTDEQGAIAAISLAAQACAIGQASAALFAASALGKAQADIVRAADALEAWLRHNGPMPDWPGLATLSVARDYPARHGAMMLPWRAAIEALSQTVPAR